MRGGYFSEESKVGFYRCPGGYLPTLDGRCVDAKNRFKRTPWFFRAEEAVGGADSGEDSMVSDDTGDGSADEELQVSGPSRYDPTGKESRVSGPARVDHWDDPMSMKASANSALEEPMMHKVVQPML